jgi:hypothetical protein
MDVLEFSPEQNEALTALADRSDQALVESGQNSATRGFNLGCSLSLLPAAILVILAFILTRGSWVFGFVSILLALVAVAGVANLVASTAKEKAMQRTYNEKIAPEIELKLSELQMDQDRFGLWVSKNMPDGAVLRNYVTLPPELEVETLTGSNSDQE